MMKTMGNGQCKVSGSWLSKETEAYNPSHPKFSMLDKGFVMRTKAH